MDTALDVLKPQVYCYPPARCYKVHSQCFHKTKIRTPGFRHTWAHTMFYSVLNIKKRLGTYICSQPRGRAAARVAKAEFQTNRLRHRVFPPASSTSLHFSQPTPRAATNSRRGRRHSHTNVNHVSRSLSHQAVPHHGSGSKRGRGDGGRHIIFTTAPVVRTTKGVPVLT